MDFGGDGGGGISSGQFPPPLDNLNLHQQHQAHSLHSFFQFPAANPNPAGADSAALHQTGLDQYQAAYYYSLVVSQQLNASMAAGHKPAVLPVYGRKSGRTGIANLEMKKQTLINGGTSADSIKVCLICDVVCNSEKVFASHLAGEKHVMKASGLSKLKHANAVKIKKAANRAYKLVSSGTVPGGINFTHSTYCNVCNINCNSADVYNTHIMGRKHRHKLQLLQEAIAPKPPPSTVVTTTGAPPSKASAGARGTSSKVVSAAIDVNTKMRKVVAAGADMGAMRTCAICGGVCNSQTVFDIHLAGQKHAAMVKKQPVGPLPAC